MPCKIERPDPQELFDRIKGDFSANVLGGFDVVPESLEWYVIANDYAMHEQLFSLVDQQMRSMDPRYACHEDLYQLAAMDGMTPKPATFSQGYAKISGAPGSVIPSSLEITFGSSRFIVVGCDSTAIGSSGSAVVRLQAITPGPEANSAADADSLGSVQNTSTGLSASALAYGRFCGGANEEDPEQFRMRYIERKSYKPKATHAWLIDKIKEWPCVTRVAQRSGSCCANDVDTPQTCGCSSCLNKLEFYPLFDNTFDCGIPPTCVVDEMNTWLFGSPVGHGMGQVEIGVCGKLYAARASVVDVMIQGLSCATINQVAQVKERVSDFFRNLSPSQLVTTRSIEIIVAQVMGDFGDYTVSFRIKSGDAQFTSCGDLDPPCDVLPCLGEVIPVNASSSQLSCG